MLICYILLSFYTTKLKRKNNKTKSSTAVEALCNYQTPHNHLMWDVYGSNNFEKDRDSKQMQQ